MYSKNAMFSNKVSEEVRCKKLGQAIIHGVLTRLRSRDLDTTKVEGSWGEGVAGVCISRQQAVVR